MRLERFSPTLRMASPASCLPELVTYFTSTDASNPNPFKRVLTGTYRSPLADLLLALHKAKRVSVVRPPDPEDLVLLGTSAQSHASNASAEPSAAPKQQEAGGRQLSSILKPGDGATCRSPGRQANAVARKFSEGRRMVVGRSAAGSMMVRHAGADVAEVEVEEESAAAAAAGADASEAVGRAASAGRAHNAGGKSRTGGGERQRERQRAVMTYLTTDPPVPKHVSFQETALKHEFDTVSIDSSTADEEETLAFPNGRDGEQVDPVLEAFRRWVGSSARKSLSLAVPIAMPADGSGHQLRHRQRPVTMPADMLEALAQRIAAQEAAEQEAEERKSGAVRASDDQLFGSKAARRRAARVTLV